MDDLLDLIHRDAPIQPGRPSPPLLLADTRYGAIGQRGDQVGRLHLMRHPNWRESWP
jgi:hypothetical protein